MALASDELEVVLQNSLNVEMSISEPVVRVGEDRHNFVLGHPENPIKESTIREDLLIRKKHRPEPTQSTSRGASIGLAP